MSVVYLLLGGNMGDRKDYLERARVSLSTDVGSIEAASLLYETEAWGVKEQAPFLNQALKINTLLEPVKLLNTILSIERALGRTREAKYGPRTIDIDILLYDDYILNLPYLTIPHPFLPQRRFALQCLNAIAPHIKHPLSGKTIHDLLQECPDSSMVHKFA